MLHQISFLLAIIRFLRNSRYIALSPLGFVSPCIHFNHSRLWLAVTIELMA